MPNRRSFLKEIFVFGLIVKSAFVAFIFRKILYKHKRKLTYPVTFITHLPNTLSQDNYNKLKEKWMDVSGVFKEYKVFRIKKKIISEESCFSGNTSYWKVLFRDHDAYLEWLESTDHLFNDPVMEKLGVKLETKTS